MEENISERVEQVPSHVAALVYKILDGWTPSVPSFASPVRFLWHGRDLSSGARDLLIDGDTLKVQCSGLKSVFIDHAQRNALRNEPFEGDLSDGSKFQADSAFLDVDHATGHYWSVTDPQRPAHLWVACVHGFNLPRMAGNLIINWVQTLADGTTTEWTLSGSHRFHGAYTYYLIQRERLDGSHELSGSNDGAWFLIIESTSPPSRAHIYPDILGLQFVFGRTLYFDLLHGLDGSHNQVAIVGGRHGREYSQKQRVQPPVPIDFCAEHWASSLFTAISDTYRARPELRLYIALNFYLDALASFHVEGQYMTLHVTLEAFAFWLLNQEPEADRPLVDKTKWREWLRENKDKIKALATPGLGETLYNKITSIPARRASSRVVEDAFQLMDIEITAEMAPELEDGRGTIVHTAVMFQEFQENLDAYTSRIAIVRTMLVALIARAVGYKGAILGWTKSPGRPYDEPDASWWPVANEARAAALQGYMIESGSQCASP